MSNLSISFSTWYAKDQEYCERLQRAQNEGERNIILQERRIHLEERHTHLKRNLEEQDKLQSKTSFNAFDDNTPIGERLKRSGYNQRFLYIRLAEHKIKAFKAQKLPKIKRLEIINKVMDVFLTLLPIALSFSFLYSPVRVSLGIGAAILVLVSIQGLVVESRKERLEHEYDSLLKYWKLLKSHNFKVVHPIGEWDLPKVDDRLRSDHLNIEGAERKRPKAADTLERVVNCRAAETVQKRELDEKDNRRGYDLEVSTFVDYHTAKETSQFSDREAKWEDITSKVKNAKSALRGNGNYEAYQKGLKEAANAALFPQETDFFIHPENFPMETEKDLVNSVMRQYAHLKQVVHAAQESYHQIVLLYEKIPDKNPLIKKWTDLNEEFQKCKDILDRSSQIAADNWLILSHHFQKEKIFPHLQSALHKAKEFGKECQPIIDNFPSKRLEKYEKELRQLDKNVLSHNTLVTLYNHIESDLPLAPEVDAQVREWRKSHSAVGKKPLIEIYERNRVMRQAVGEALTKLEDLKKRFQTKLGLSNASQQYEDLKKELEHFYELSFKEATYTCRKLTTISAWEQCKRALRPTMFQVKPFRRIHIPPFEPQITEITRAKDTLVCRSQKIEQKFLEKTLKSLDRKIFWTTLGNKLGIEVAVKVFLIAEVFLLYYSVTASWTPLAFIGATTFLEFVSLYVGWKLKKMDPEKLSLKYGYPLKDRVVLPSTLNRSPVLEELNRVETTYSLDLIEGTKKVWWREALAYGEKHVKNEDFEVVDRTVRPLLEVKYLSLESELSNPDVKNSSEKRAEEIVPEFDSKCHDLHSKGDELKAKFRITGKTEKDTKKEIKKIRRNLNREGGQLIAEYIELPTIRHKELKVALFPEKNPSDKTWSRKKYIKTNSAESDQDNLFEQLKEAQGNLEELRKLYRFISFEPKTLLSIFESNEVFARWREMSNLLNLALNSNAARKSLVDVDDLLNSLIGQLSQNQNTDEKFRELQTVSKSVLRRALHVLDLAFQKYKLEKILEAIRSAREKEKGPLLQNPNNVCTLIDQDFEAEGKISGETLEKLQYVSDEFLVGFETRVELQIKSCQKEIDFIEKRVQVAKKSIKDPTILFVGRSNLYPFLSSESKEEFGQKMEILINKVRNLNPNNDKERMGLLIQGFKDLVDAIVKRANFKKKALIQGSSNLGL